MKDLTIGRPRPKVLIVDDRRENLLATQKVLQVIEADLVLAGSGNEALQLMLHTRFAVVLLDVQMPEMDGFETASLMRHHDQMKGTPIIFITAISKDEKYVDQAAELGAVDYIFKPINPNILVSKVKVFVELFEQRESLKKYAEEIGKKNEELERFAFACSHDLKEPVRTMTIFADLARQRSAGALDEKGLSHIERIISTGTRLQKMIEDILQFSRIGHESLQVEEVDTEQKLHAVLERLAEPIAQSGAKIDHDNLPTVTAPGDLIDILLGNLISNSLKFVSADQEPRIQISASRVDDNWLFSITDNGIGIGEGDEETVFAPFRRLHTREEYPGSGIGLSICKKLLNQCGGEIWYENAAGGGVTFSFSLPASLRTT